MTDLVGRVLSGRYRLVAPIGAGASAQVFLAEDARLRRRVAVKLLHAALADDDAFLRRFRAEAQAAAALNHPHIVAVYDWGEDEGTPYLVTELLSGGSLRGMLDAGHRLTPSQALLVGLEASRALEHAHRRGFVHRDIKPANLLFGDDGRLRIADFGLARALAEAAWTEPAGAVLGTARYASPEQARGEPVDGRADVYALALVLVEAVTGKVPFAADTTIGTLMARVDRPIEVPPALGPLGRVLERAGRPDPAERPDAGEFGVGLMAAAEELPRPEPLPLAGAMPVTGSAVVDADPTGISPRFGAVAPVPAADADGPGAGLGGGLGGGLGAAVDLEVPAQRTRRRWPKVLLALVVAAVLAGGGYAASQFLLVPSHEVPDFVGDRQEDAEEVIEANNWEVEIREGRADDSEPGEVLSQDPPPGEKLKEGRTVVLTVSLGRELRTVPADLAGKTVEEAAAAISAAGLVPSEPEHAYSEDVPAGIVISLVEGTPPTAETGSPIAVVVSDGPEPRTVPEIAPGSDPAAACAPIEALQLVCTQGQGFSDTVPAGQVVGTQPAAGERVERGATVTVVVSQGPELIEVPNVSGQNVNQAVQALQNAGFRVEVLPQEARGRVIVTDPLPGERVRRGSTVSVFARR